MNEKERKELIRYFVLCTYRDSDIFLLDEYEELEQIIKNNKVAQYLEDVRYQYLKNKITKEEYNNIRDDYYCKLVLKKNN